MKLTKLQRYTLYCIFLQEAEKDYKYYYLDKYFSHSKEYGLCWLYRLITARYDLLFRFKTMLPELYDKATTRGIDRMYFNNWKERIKALKQCIEETHP